MNIGRLEDSNGTVASRKIKLRVRTIIKFRSVIGNIVGYYSQVLHKTPMVFI
jgi:hypothetical protein